MACGTGETTLQVEVLDVVLRYHEVDQPIRPTNMRPSPLPSIAGENFRQNASRTSFNFVLLTGKWGSDKLLAERRWKRPYGIRKLTSNETLARDLK